MEFPAEQESSDMTEEDATLALRHVETRELYKLKTFKIPGNYPLPSLLTIYFDQQNAIVPTVPEDLQLSCFSALYDNIAGSGFLAIKDKAQDINGSIAIWFYEVDLGHAFSRFWD